MITVFSKPIGQLQTNCYILGSVMIDPGDDVPALKAFVEETGTKPKYILLTHGHFDHMLGAYAMREYLGAKVYIGKADALALSDSGICMASAWCATPFTPMEPDGFLDAGETEFDGLKFKVISTPGHTKGGVALYSEQHRILISGDTLFAHGYGRTDFPGGSMEQLAASLRTLLALPDDTMVYSGHYESALMSEIRKGYSL